MHVLKKGSLLVTILLMLIALPACRDRVSEPLLPSQDMLFVKSDDGDGPEGWFPLGNPMYAPFYQTTVDETGGPDGQPALQIHSTAMIGGSGNFGGVSRGVPFVNRFRGHRVRLSATIKSEDVHRAGLWLRVDGRRNHIVAFDNMGLRPIVGTTDWHQYEVVLDIPAVGQAEVEHVGYGFLLSGPGQVWVSDMRLEAVGDDVPVTDLLLSAPEPANLDFSMTAGDQLADWRVGGSHLWAYSVGIDMATAFVGDQSGTIHSDTAEPNAWASLWQRVDAAPYHNQQVRLSAHLRTADVAQNVTAAIAMQHDLMTIIQVESAPISGTTDWQAVDLILDLDEEAESIFFTFYLEGPGQVWVDNVQLEAIGPSQFTPEMVTTVRQEQIFEQLWTLFYHNYVYPDFNGMDWTAVYDEYQAQMKAGLTQEEFWAAMKGLIAALDDDHSFFLTPAEAEERSQFAAGDQSYGGIGLISKLVEIENEWQVVALYTLPDSPAAAAGIQSRDRLLAADGIPLCCDAAGFERADLVRGPVDTPVTITVQTPDEEPRDLVITRSHITATVPVISRRLEGDIGYMMIPTLSIFGIDEQVEAGWQALNDPDPVAALIIDLRLNQGGEGQVLQGILALFTDGKLGEFQRRGFSRDLVVSGHDVAGSQTVPLIVLVGEWTESYAEVLAGSLQEAGRATLIGQRTAANVETIFFEKFMDGSQVFIATELFIPPSGIDYNQDGVIPDVELTQAWYEATGDADDEALTAAWAFLNSR
jgi:carboxyl-terminal processing protease